MKKALQQNHFYRLKAAMHDLIIRAGGIDRASVITGYSKTQVWRWSGRESVDLMPMSAVVNLEQETGAPLVTQALCAINGLETSPFAPPPAHLFGAYVDLSQDAAELAHGMADAVADSVVTVTEQKAIDRQAAALDQSTERLRSAIAATGGKAVRLESK